MKLEAGVHDRDAVIHQFEQRFLTVRSIVESKDEEINALTEQLSDTTKQLTDSTNRIRDLEESLFEAEQRKMTETSQMNDNFKEVDMKAQLLLERTV